MICANQELQMSLGEPVLVQGFKDGKNRLCYPFTLKNLNLLNGLLSGIDQEDLYENFKDEKATQIMASLFALSFKAETDEELHDLLYSIGVDNFAEIVSDIKKISGIVDDNGEVDVGKTTNTIDWDVAINSIPIYTSTPHEKVKDLTLKQFNMTLNLIGKKINYEYKTNTIGLVNKPSDYISESDHPLYSEPKFEDKKVVTMKDIQGLMSMSK